MVEACQAGDREAYAQLTKRHAGQVYAVCLGMMTHAHDAEDVAQEALLKGYAQIGSLRDGERFRYWIVQIARHLCLDTLRRRQRRREVQSERLEPLERETSDHSELHGAISQLPEKYRESLLLYYFDGQSTQGVARSLGISSALACTRLSRARTILRKRLEQQEPLP